MCWRSGCPVCSVATSWIALRRSPAELAMLHERAQTELLATFQVELAEHTQSLTRAFLALEKEPESAERRRLLAAAFRSPHNLKGAARAGGLSAVETLAHHMEGVLGAASREEVELSPDLFDLLFAAVDSLSAAATAEDS